LRALDPILVLGLMLSLYVAWAIGTNDAANPTNIVVGSGALTPKKALTIFTIFVFLGSIAQGWMVSKTFGGGITKIESAADALTATISTGIWITLASLTGMPISTTHSAVGGVLGIGLYKVIKLKSIEFINWGVLSKVVISWITSPLSALLLCFIFMRLFDAVIDRALKRGVDPKTLDNYIKRALIAGFAFSAYSFGANDVSNAVGVYSVFASLSGVATGFNMQVALTLSAIGALGIALGGFTLGYRVINTIAYKITRIDVRNGLSAQLSNALVVWLFTTLPTLIWGYGMPISTTHAAVTAVLGVGLGRYGVKGVDWGVVSKIVFMWLITVPITALISLTLRWVIYTVLNM